MIWAEGSNSTFDLKLVLNKKSKFTLLFPLSRYLELHKHKMLWCLQFLLLCSQNLFTFLFLTWSQNITWYPHGDFSALFAVVWMWGGLHNHATLCLSSFDVNYYPSQVSLFGYAISFPIKAKSQSKRSFTFNKTELEIR